MAGKKRSRVGLEQFGVTLPEGVYREMIEIIDRERRWDGRVEFAREAIKEKIERHRVGRPKLTEGSERTVRETRSP